MTKGAEEARPGKGWQMRLQVVVVVDGVVGKASHADSSLKNKTEFFGKSKTRTRLTMDFKKIKILDVENEFFVLLETNMSRQTW